MFGKKKPEVLVAGAGPVGLMTALALARHGIRVEIVDKEWRTGTRSYALALHAGSLQLLEDFGLLSEVLEHAYRVRTIGLYDGAERRAEMRVSDLAEDHSFVAVMRQDWLEQILEKALNKAGTRVEWSRELSRVQPGADSVQITLDKLSKETLGYIIPHTEWAVTKSTDSEVPFVVGADGHRSRVRRSLDIDFPELGEPQDYAVFEFQTDVDFAHEMRLGLTDGTLNVLWPLPENYCRCSFQMPVYEKLEHSREKERGFGAFDSALSHTLKDETLRELLAERAPWFEGEPGPIRWRMVVRFEKRLADSFGQGRVWLAGDAGHMTGPAGVQSMNVGLREAVDLAAALKKVLRDGAPLNELEAYGRARAAEWRRLLGMEGAVRADAESDPWIAGMKDLLLPCVPASGEGLERLLGQVSLQI